MDKLVITGDWHLNNTNARKKEYKYLKEILETYRKANYKLVVLGDVFDSTTSVSWDLYYDVFVYFSLWDEVIIVCGNHDVSLRNKLISPQIHILLTLPNVNKTKDYTLWHYYSNQPIGSGDILFTHKDIKELNKYYDKDFAVSLNDFEKYRIVFNGHLHKPIKRKNVIVVGPPYPTNRIEETDGIILLFGGGNEVKPVRTYITKYTDDITKIEDYASKYKRVVYTGSDDISERNLPPNVEIVYTPKKYAQETVVGLGFYDICNVAVKEGVLTEKQKRILEILYEKEKSKIESSIHTED